MAVLQDADVPEHGAARRRPRDAGGHFAVVALERRQKPARVLPPRQRLRHEAVHLHLAEVHLQPDLPRQDEQLPRDILAGQILAWIGLGEPHAVRIAHDRAEWDAAVERVEQVAQRPRQNALDPDDLVAAGDEIAQRGHDRQPRADVGLEEKVPLAPLEHRHQRRVAAPRQRVRPLVRRDDVEVRFDERRIRVDDGRADRTVDERRVGQLHLLDPARERRRVHGRGRGMKPVPPR